MACFGCFFWIRIWLSLPNPGLNLCARIILLDNPSPVYKQWNNSSKGFLLDSTYRQKIFQWGQLCCPHFFSLAVCIWSESDLFPLSRFSEVYISHRERMIAVMLQLETDTRFVLWELLLPLKLLWLKNNSIAILSTTK